jgi:hypothetical protein
MIKLTLRLSGAAEKAFKDMSQAGVPVEELLPDALALLDFAMQKTSEGQKIGSFDEENKQFQGISLPSLDVLQRHKPK